MIGLIFKETFYRRQEWRNKLIIKWPIFRMEVNNSPESASCMHKTIGWNSVQNVNDFLFSIKNLLIQLIMLLNTLALIFVRKLTKLECFWGFQETFNYFFQQLHRLSSGVSNYKSIFRHRRLDCWQMLSILVPQISNPEQCLLSFVLLLINIFISCQLYQTCR